VKKMIAFRRPEPATADAWIGAGTETEAATASPTPMKRLTIDIPTELHRRVKRECADRGTKMADIVRELLTKEFPS